MAKRIKVRFNLGRGVNYFKWKVEYPDRSEYYSPTEVQLVLAKCEVKNNQKTANKIFEGKHKQVCAWVLCEQVLIRKNNFESADTECPKLKYNPKVLPHWVIGDNKESVDGQRFSRLISVDYSLYIKKV
jgi:hypothetical protein